MIRRKPIFYGWYIVGVMIIALMLVYGIRFSFSVFFAPILEEFHWYRGSTAIMLSLNIFVYGVTAPFAGRLVDRWKPRKVVVIGLLLIALSTASCHFAHELWHFYLLFGVLSPIGSAFCGSPVFNPTLVNWFGKKRGLAIGLGQIGGGLSIAYAMFIEAVISRWGWQSAFFVMGGMIIFISLPLYYFFFYYRPEDKGMLSYDAGETSINEATNAVPSTPDADWTLGAALRSYHLWLLVFAEFCFWGIGNYMVMAHQVKYAEDAGYSSLLAASVFALVGIASIGGQICSYISDSIGREKTLTIAVVLSIGALIALMSVRDTSQPWLLYVYAVSSGFATGLFSPIVIVGLADIFRGRNIGVILALLLTGSGIGGAIGPWLGGYIYDVMGSYNLAFIISMAAFAVGCISFWIAAPRNADKIRARL